MQVLSRSYILVMFVLCIMGSEKAHAQDWEYGVMAGFANYFGDLNSNTSFEYIGPHAGLFARCNIGERFAVKAGFNYGQVSFADEASDYPFQRARNLSFASSIMEITVQGEVNFFRYDKRRLNRDRNFTPYLLAGVSGFFFNPKAELDGERYALQPIGTEGQNLPGEKRYVRLGVAIPLGGGFKYSFHPAWTIGVEMGVRKTFTDKLDDVSGEYPDQVVAFDVPNSVSSLLSDRSEEVGEPIGRPGKQRGLSPAFDDYMFFGLSLSYTVLKTRCPKPSKI